MCYIDLMKYVRCVVIVIGNSVAGKCNPADILSKGCSGNELLHNDMWWNRLSFLLSSPQLWPNLSTLLEVDGANLKLSKTALVFGHLLIATTFSNTNESTLAVTDITR